MGNCPVCLSRRSIDNTTEEEAVGAHEEEGEMVRVIRTTDNELFEFPGPVSVKDLLFGFQGFAVFHENSSILRKRQEPLHPDTLLKFSHLYYLKPLLHPALITTPLSSYDGSKCLLAEQSSNKLWIKQAFIKPLIDIKPLDDHAEAVITHNHDHAEALITMNPQNESARDGLPEGSLPPSHHHDRAFNELAEGLLPPIQNPSQSILKAKKVRFSDEVMAIPSLNKIAIDDDDDSVAPKSSQNDISASKEELASQFGKATGQFDKQVGYYSVSKEELVPYLSRKEMNGVVRLKVVISKKQLTELMSSSRDEQSNASVEKMLAPLLSPTNSTPHKTDSLHGGSSSPSWRPSLGHIPEDHPCIDSLP